VGLAGDSTHLASNLSYIVVSKSSSNYMNNSSYIFFRLRAAGLLTLCRLVEGGPVPDGGAKSRFNLDRSLLTALLTDGGQRRTRSTSHAGRWLRPCRISPTCLATTRR